MNCTLSRSVDIVFPDFHEEFVQDVNTGIESAYATVPTPAVKPSFQQPDEEELHTSFEEAISDRLLALHSRLDRISQPLSDALPHNIGSVLAQTTTTAQVQDSSDQQEHATQHSLNVNTGQRITIFACLALMLILSGFDLMGFLVLHTH
jgi:hypothetical protein